MEPLPIHSDGTVDIPAQRLTAQGIEHLVHQLAITRAQLTPPVQDSPPKVGEQMEQPDPIVKLAALDGSPRLAMLLRHMAFGWVTFTFDFEHLKELHAYLGQFLARRNPPSDIHSGSSHQH